MSDHQWWKSRDGIHGRWNPGLDEIPDEHNAKWYFCWDGTVWSRGPDKKFDWWQMEEGKVPPWRPEQADPLPRPTSSLTYQRAAARRVLEPTNLSEARLNRGQSSTISALAIESPMPKANRPGTARHIPPTPLDWRPPPETAPPSVQAPPPPKAPQAKAGGATAAKPPPPNPPPPLELAQPQQVIATTAPSRTPPKAGPSSSSSSDTALAGGPAPAVNAGARTAATGPDALERLPNSFPDHPMSKEDGRRNCDWDIAYFRGYGDQVGFVEQKRKKYNEALKHLRSFASDINDGKDIRLPDFRPIAISPIIHDKGISWLTDPDGTATAFSWREMVAHIDDEERKYKEDTATALELVVGSGVRECWFKNDPNVYDHQMCQHKTRAELRSMTERGETEKVWDFVIVRIDGSEIAIHPSFKKNEISYREVKKPNASLCRTGPPVVPKRGQGQSDGHGTFKTMKRNMHDFKLKFNVETFK